jgi:hypothetical protein
VTSARAYPAPFDQGLWLLAVVGDATSVLLAEDGVDGDGRAVVASEASLREEMGRYRSVCVVSRRRYLFTQARFPIPAVDSAGKRTGGFLPATLASVGRHEALLELRHEFPMFMCLHDFAFMSMLHEEDVARLAEAAKSADVEAVRRGVT